MKNIKGVPEKRSQTDGETDSQTDGKTHIRADEVPFYSPPPPMSGVNIGNDAKIEYKLPLCNNNHLRCYW